MTTERVGEIGKYGGISTRMIDVPVGTSFYVCNGCWNGTVILKEGEKHILIDGDAVENAIKILDDDYLDLSRTEYTPVKIGKLEHEKKILLSKVSGIEEQIAILKGE